MSVRSPLVRGAATVLAYLLALAVTAPLALLVVLVLAGPHAGLLPQAIEVAVLAAGWVAVLVLPPLAARRVWSALGGPVRGAAAAP